MSVKPPFGWFGGKRRVAPEVWQALGDVQNYVEPFFGSGAILLNRPAWHKGYTDDLSPAVRIDQPLPAHVDAVAHLVLLNRTSLDGDLGVT